VETYSDFAYDSLGRMTRGPDANWYPADTQYDALDRPIETPDGRGHQWDTVYDANGNPLYVGLTVNGAYLDGHYATWDALDRQDRYVDYAGNATLTQYNALGHVTQLTNADGYSVSFERDALGRITGAYNQQGQRVSLSLDAAGRPRTSTDPNDLTTQYDYHHASEDGRLKRTTLPTGSGQTQGRAVEIAAYDGAGRPTRIHHLAADGTMRDSYRFYDELGRLTREVGPPTSATTDTAAKTCNLADANLKRQLTRTYDDWGRKLTETDALGFITRAETRDGSNHLIVAYDYAYDPAQRLRSVTDARGNKTIRYTWTPGGRLAAISAPNAENVAYTWDAGGRLIERRLGSGLITTQSWYEDGSKITRTRRILGQEPLSSRTRRRACPRDAPAPRSRRRRPAGGR